jgi:hypothetical protein
VRHWVKNPGLLTTTDALTVRPLSIASSRIGRVTEIKMHSLFLVSF